MIKHVCSLGSFCHTAAHLKRFNMRTCSYPFDWIISSPRMVIECIRDDFKTFMNPVHHVPLQAGISSNHLIYGNMSWGNNFLGKPPIGLTFNHRDITLPENYAYYERCIQRFRTLLASPESKLFILITQDVEYDPNEIHELRDLLREKTTNFKILCITLQNDNNMHSHIDSVDEIIYLKLFSYGRSGGWGLAHEEEDKFLNYIINCYYSFEYPT
jgi:Putative papain-like cysteine peptidase (DUF1796)